MMTHKQDSTQILHIWCKPKSTFHSLQSFSIYSPCKNNDRAFLALYTLPILAEAKETAVKQLKLLCDEVRFIRLTDALDSFSEKEQKYLDEGKKKKFNNLKLGSTKHPVSAINTGKGHSKNQSG